MNNDNVSVVSEVVVDLGKECEPEECSLRRSARIAKDKQKRVLYYEKSSRISKKRKRTDSDEVKSDKSPKIRRGRPRKDEQKPIGRPRGRQAKTASSKRINEQRFPPRDSQ